MSVRRWMPICLGVQVACGGQPSRPEPPVPPRAEVPVAPAPASDKPTAPEEPAPHGAALPTEALAARAAAQHRVLGEVFFGDNWPSHDPEAREDVLDARTLGVWVSLRGAGDPALGRFHAALRELASGAGPDRVRVAFYGSSGTASDYVTSYVRAYLQLRFGDAGHGFVALAAPWNGYRHLDVAVQTSAGWHTDHAQRDDRRLDGEYGLLGASVSTRTRSHRTEVRLRPAAVGSRHELHFLTWPEGGGFTVHVDGKPVERVETRAETMRPGRLDLNLPSGARRIGIRPEGNGEVRLFGMVVEREGRGVVVDTLGISGSRAANHLLWNEAHWSGALAARAPVLYVLAYGGNEAGDTEEEMPLATYRRELGLVLDRFERAAPNASCLLVGPGDYPLVTAEGTVEQRPRLGEVIAIQRAVALARGCAFFDTQAFMGGPLAILAWERARPELARNDHLHLTRRGYVRVAMGLMDAVMYGFDHVP